MSRPMLRLCFTSVFAFLSSSVSVPLTLLVPQRQIWPSLCLVSIVVWMLVSSSVSNPQSEEQEKKTTSGKRTSFSQKSSLKTCSMSFPPTQLLFMCFRFFLFQCYTCFSSLCDLFLVHTLQYAVFLPNTIHTLKQQEGVLSICHMPSSVLDSTAISGLQYFSHCSQFSCTVLCNFHMDVYDFICCHTNLEILQIEITVQWKIKV